jgi:glycerophosphoryl diester phosphodiesterase
MFDLPIFVLQGHRGARGLFPENTLAGFRGALALGVSSLELDIAVTRDGVPVVVHDPRLNPDLTRDASGAWLDGAGPAVGGLTLAELQRFDVGRARPGSSVARAFPLQQPHDGEKVPTLADVLAATQASGVRIDAEIKTDPRALAPTMPPERMAEIVVAVARAAGALGRLSVRSFDWRGPAWLRRTQPAVPLCWLTEAKTEADAALWWGFSGLSTPRAVAAAAAAGEPAAWTPTWAPDHTGLSAGQVAEARAIGLRVVPWTVDDPADMARLIGWGVAGLCTDRPDLARRAMAAAGLPLPPPWRAAR